MPPKQPGGPVADEEIDSCADDDAWPYAEREMELGFSIDTPEGRAVHGALSSYRVFYELPLSVRFNMIASVSGSLSATDGVLIGAKPITLKGPAEYTEPCGNCDGTDLKCNDCFGRGDVGVTLVRGSQMQVWMAPNGLSKVEAAQ